MAAASTFSSSKKGRPSSPRNPGCVPQSNMMVFPLNLRRQHDRPTSLPAPSGMNSSVSSPCAVSGTARVRCQTRSSHNRRGSARRGAGEGAAQQHLKRVRSFRAALGHCDVRDGHVAAARVRHGGDCARRAAAARGVRPPPPRSAHTAPRAAGGSPSAATRRPPHRPACMVTLFRRRVRVHGRVLLSGGLHPSKPPCGEFVGRNPLCAGLLGGQLQQVAGARALQT